MRRSIVELEDIHFGYGQHVVLNGVTFGLREHERVGIVGAIGSGKTTLLHLVVGLLKPTAGRLRVFAEPRTREEDFREVRTRIGLVFQDPDDQLFCPTVIEDVAFGPLNLGRQPEEARRLAQHALERVGLARLADRVTYRLSGGEKRLVALATVLAMEPEVLLLDEPTASLDARAVDRVVETLNHLPQAMLVVSHEPAFLERITDHRVVLDDGRIAPMQH